MKKELLPDADRLFDFKDSPVVNELFGFIRNYQVPAHIYDGNESGFAIPKKMDLLFQEMWRLRAKVLEKVKEFVDTYVISGQGILTTFDNARLRMMFDEPPGDKSGEIAGQMGNGSLEGKFQYFQSGADAYLKITHSADYPYREGELRLLREQKETLTGVQKPRTVISLGCGTGE